MWGPAWCKHRFNYEVGVFGRKVRVPGLLELMDVESSGRAMSGHTSDGPSSKKHQAKSDGHKATPWQRPPPHPPISHTDAAELR